MGHLRRIVRYGCAAGLLVTGLTACNPTGENDPELTDTSADVPEPSEDTDDGSPDTMDTSDAPEAIETGLDDDRTISDLSGAEKRTVCRAGEAFVLDRLSREAICLWAAHLQTAQQSPETDEEASQTCRDVRRACNDGERMELCSDISGGDECTEQVGQWEVCEHALGSRFVADVENLPSCSQASVTFYDEEFSATIEVDAEACSGLRDNCGAFYNRWVGPTKSP